MERLSSFNYTHLLVILYLQSKHVGNGIDNICIKDVLNVYQQNCFKNIYIVDYNKKNLYKLYIHFLKFNILHLASSFTISFLWVFCVPLLLSREFEI